MIFLFHVFPFHVSFSRISFQMRSFSLETDLQLFHLTVKLSLPPLSEQNELQMRSLLRAFFYSSSITNFQGSGSFCYPENRSKHSFFQSSRRRNSPFSTSFLLAKFNQIFTVFAIIFHNNNRVFKLLFLRSHIFIILVILYTFFFF